MDEMGWDGIVIRVLFDEEWGRKGVWGKEGGGGGDRLIDR